MKTKITKKTVIIIILFLFVFYAFYNFVFIKRNYSREEYNTIITNDMERIYTYLKMYYIQTGANYPQTIDDLRKIYPNTPPTNPFGKPYMLDTKELDIYTMNDDNRKIKIKFYIPRYRSKIIWPPEK